MAVLAQSDLGEELMTAVADKDLSAVKVLLERGANVNYAGLFGWSPLRLACRALSEEIIRLLIDWGANVNHKTGGRTILEWQKSCLAIQLDFEPEDFEDREHDIDHWNARIEDIGKRVSVIRCLEEHSGDIAGE